MPRVNADRAFVRALNILNKGIKRGDSYKFKLSEMREVWNRDKGRCRFCGCVLHIKDAVGASALFFKLYIPQEFGGKRELWNVVLCCRDDYEGYRAAKTVLGEDIPDVNTFADLTEQLIKATIKKQTAKPEVSILLDEKIRRLKIMINDQLTDVAATMRYKPFKDWIPEDFELVVEGENTIPDIVEEITEAACEENADAVSSGKEKFTDSIKQVQTTKQYKIVKNVDS